MVVLSTTLSLIARLLAVSKLCRQIIAITHVGTL